MDINSVLLIGRITRDAELKYTSSGTAICRFSLAVNRRVKTGDTWGEEGNFFDVTLFGKSGESLNQYLAKGKQVAVQGELKQDRWEQDGQSRSKVGIIANGVQLLGSKDGQGSTQNKADRESRGNGPERNGAAPASQNGDKSGDDFQDDIPF